MWEKLPPALSDCHFRLVMEALITPDDSIMIVGSELRRAGGKPVPSQGDVACPRKLMDVEILDEIGDRVFLMPRHLMTVQKDRTPRQSFVVVNDVAEVHLCGIKILFQWIHIDFRPTIASKPFAKGILNFASAFSEFFTS